MAKEEDKVGYRELARTIGKQLQCPHSREERRILLEAKQLAERASK